MKQRSLAIATAISLLLSSCGQMAVSPTADTGDGQLEWLVGVPWGQGNADGIGESARFAGPLILAADPRGGLLISDHYGDTIRRADAGFRVTTIAGQSGVTAFRDGDAHDARFSWPTGLARAADGTIYVADQGNNAIRKIAPDGRVSLLAGSPGHSGETDGRGPRARFNRPMAIAIDADHRLWVADRYNEAVRIVSPSGYVTTWPGSSTNTGTQDVPTGDTGDTDFPGIEFIAVAPDGSVVVAGEWGVSRIKGSKATRLLTIMSDDERQSIVDSSAGIPASELSADMSTQLRDAKREGPHVATISGMALRADGVIFLSDKSQGLVFQLGDDGAVTVVAGRKTGERHNGADGPADVALLDEPGSLAFDNQGRLFVANKSMSVQQILPDGEVRNVLGLARWYDKYGVDPARALHGSCDVAVANERGDIFVVQRLDDEIHQFDASGRHVRQFGKERESLGTPDVELHADGNAEHSRFNFPQDIALGLNGELFVADKSGIRRIGPDGQVGTLAGGAGTSHRRDGSLENARFFRPYRLAFDGRRYLYLLDNSPYIGRGPVPEVVRRLDLETRQVTTVIDAEALDTAYASVPPESLPYFTLELRDIAVGPAGRLYVLGDTGDLYTWTPTEGLKIAHLPGHLTSAGSEAGEETILDADGKKVENHLIRYATLSGSTEYLAVDTYGNAYMTDPLTDVVMRLDPEGHIDLIAGTPGKRGNVAGSLPGTLEDVEGLSITPAGDLLITVMHSGVIRIKQPHRVHGQRIVLTEPGRP